MPDVAIPYSFAEDNGDCHVAVLQRLLAMTSIKDSETGSGNAAPG